MEIWAGVETEWQASEKNSFYLDHQSRHTRFNDGNNLANSGPLSQLESARFTLGYERLLHPNWAIGVAQRASVEKEETKWYNRLMLFYLRNFNKTELETRLLIEHIRAKDNTTEKSKIKPENRARGNVGLSRPFAVGKQEFEVATEVELRFDIGAETETKPRVVDRSRLELGLTWQISNHVEFTVFGIRQVNYDTQPEEQPEGTPNSGGIYKRNRIRPIMGLEIEIGLP